MRPLRRLLRRLSKPHFLFSPRLLARRISWSVLGPPRAQVVNVALPWGLPVRCRLDDAIGSAICRTGVFELIVAEAIWRLSDPGELAVDAGANIGYMTSALALRVGPGGSVIALEPHPEVFGDLETSVTQWTHRRDVAPVAAHRVALSDTSGRSELVAPPIFSHNRGVAAVAGTPASLAGGARFPIELVTLDELLGPERRVGVLKMDVEGHEEALLRGAASALDAGRIRDIVFEAHEGYPSPVSRLLESYGYRIFALVPGLLRPEAVDPSAAVDDLRPPWEAPNSLATLDSGRALRRLRSPGWRVLGV